MEYTSYEAGKMLKKLGEEQTSILLRETQGKEFLAAVIADLEEKTLFMTPDGEYKGKTYSIPSEYVKNESRERVLKLPQDYRIELREKRQITAIKA